MKTCIKLIVICSAATLLLIVAHAQVPSDANLVIQVATNLGANVPEIHMTNIPEIRISGIVSNTESDVLYEMQYKQNKTNWVSVGFFSGSEITNCQPFGTWVPETNGFKRKNFRIRSWKQGYVNGIPDWWQIKTFGNVGIDAYSSPMNDGWNNIQKFEKSMSPFKYYNPVEKVEFNLEFQKSNDSTHTNARLTLLSKTHEVPEYYIIERANRSLRPTSKHVPYIRTMAGRTITNWPPNFIYTEAFQVIAMVTAKANEWNGYVDTNVSVFPEPIYRVYARYAEPMPPFAQIGEVTATAISNTILHVRTKQRTNGFELTVLHPKIRARYLLLVRDEANPTWRASGFFVSGTNQNPVCLHVDKMGMMTDAQSPVSLPTVKFLPNVVNPEFTAGWGEDSDGDALPDIYEVLVTHTDPGNEDTGDAGILDGFKMFANDGWNNWDKFLYRANPFQRCEPPAAITLTKPTSFELMAASVPKTDLPYFPRLEVRTNDLESFQPYSLWLDSNYLTPGRNGHVRCDVRISWNVPPPRP